MNYHTLNEGNKEVRLLVDFYDYEKAEKSKNKKHQKMNIKGKSEDPNSNSQGNNNYEIKAVNLWVEILSQITQ